MTAWLLNAALVAHVGLPATLDVLFDGDAHALDTTHGYVDAGGQWICEEIAGDGGAVSVLRHDGRWLIATPTGAIHSDDGCAWSSVAELEGERGVGIAVDRLDPSVTWIGTDRGLFASREGGTFELDVSTLLSLRGFLQDSGGEFFLLGFDGDVPVVETPQTSAALPEQSGRLQFLGIDSGDRVYVRVQVGLSDHIYRVSADGTIEDLFGLTDLTIGFAERDGSLYLLRYGEGVLWSDDDGRSWSAPRGASLSCLVVHGDELWACPAEYGAVALLHSSSASADPDAWTWDTALSFEEITPLQCAADTAFDQACGPLWPEVEAEFALYAEAPEDEDDETVDPAVAGCRTAPPGGSLFLALLLLASRRE